MIKTKLLKQYITQMGICIEDQFFPTELSNKY